MLYELKLKVKQLADNGEDKEVVERYITDVTFFCRGRGKRYGTVQRRVRRVRNLTVEDNRDSQQKRGRQTVFQGHYYQGVHRRCRKRERDEIPCVSLRQGHYRGK